MEFHLFNIDQKSDSEVNLYGKFLNALDAPMQTIHVSGIFSPVYFLPTPGMEDILLSEIRAFILGWDDVPATAQARRVRHNTPSIVSIENVRRQNIFNKSLGRHLDLIKITFNCNVGFKAFDSEYCELLLTEFQSPIENFVISKQIMGPGILELGPVARSTVEFKNVKFLRNSKFPSFKISALAVGNSKEFSYFSQGVDSQGVNSKSINSKSTSHSTNSTTIRSDELEEIIRKDSPDFLIFHNLHSRGRLIPRDKIACDIFSFAQGAIRCRDYSVQELCTLYRIDKRPGLEGDARALVDIACCMNVLGLAKELAEISGYLLNRCLGNSRAERIEFMLMHELYRKEFLFPAVMNRMNVKFAGGLVLEPVRGFYEDIVLLLDFNSLYPSIIQEFDVCFSTIDGLTSSVMDDDIERCLNIVNSPLTSKLTSSPHQANTLPSTSPSFLPGVLRGIVNRRNTVKDLIKSAKSPEERKALEIRQKALKLTANSIYGCLGFPSSRFCNFEMAAFITAKGRELLNETKMAADEMGMRVIYGDTDSIMILTKGEEYGRAEEMARRLVEKINGKYSRIEIELEKAFRRLLLYTKKRYAALVVSPDGDYVEMKGLDVVRRDFCLASTELGRAILDVALRDRVETGNGSKSSIMAQASSSTKSQANSSTKSQNTLKNNTKETAEIIYKICIQFYSSLFTRPASDFVITSVLSKDASLYASAMNQPHISLAMRLQAKGIPCLQDDVISYVIGEGDGPVASRAFHPDEKFAIDYDYYIKHQILPPLYRLLSLLTFVSTAKITTIFGVRDFRPAGDTLMLSMPCCQGVQAPSLVCGQCQAPVPAQFYVDTVSLRLHQAVSDLYRERGRCAECGTEYSNHLTRCFVCQRDLAYETKNEEFNRCLNGIEGAFRRVEIPEIRELVSLYSENSSYRVIDLKRYYP